MMIILMCAGKLTDAGLIRRSVRVRGIRVKVRIVRVKVATFAARVRIRSADVLGIWQGDWCPTFLCIRVREHRTFGFGLLPPDTERKH